MAKKRIRVGAVVLAVIFILSVFHAGLLAQTNLGYTSVATTPVNNGTFIYSQIFQASSSGTATSMTVYMSGDCSATLGVYASDGTVSSSLISTTSGGAFGVGGVGWKSKSISLAIVANNWYGLTVTYDGTRSIYYDLTGATPRYYTNPYTYMDGSLPATFPSGMADSLAEISIYLTYTETATGSTKIIGGRVP